jgi:Rrf2 family protein
MKITYKSDYALKALVHMSVNYTGDADIFKINELSSRLDIPLKYLEAVFVQLKNGGFVKSKRGKDGGYFLASNPSHITLGSVIRFLEGPLEPLACVQPGYKGCKDMETCVLRKVFCKVAKAESDIMDKTTLENMADEVIREKKSIDYNI